MKLGFAVRLHLNVSVGWHGWKADSVKVSYKIVKRQKNSVVKRRLECYVHSAVVEEQCCAEMQEQCREEKAVILVRS